MVITLLIYSILVIGIGLTLWYYMTIKRLEFYKNQGIVIAPGAYRFPLGNISDVMLHKSAALSNELPIKAPMNWLVEHTASLQGKQFNAAEYPIIYYNIAGTPTLVVQDPEAV